MYKYIRLITHTRNREKPTAHSCCDTCRCTIYIIMQELVRIKLTFWYYGKYTSVIFATILHIPNDMWLPNHQYKINQLHVHVHT